MFERRHYKRIAEVLKANRPNPMDYGTEAPYVTALDQWLDIVRAFTQSFELDNPAFNRAVFLNAAGAGVKPDDPE